MDANTVVNGIAWYGVFLFSTVCHEASHAFAAWKLGDPTAYEGGQVSQDPLPHMRREPMGMLLLPILSYASYGWVLGWASTPYDPVWAARNPRRATIMSFAGPVANLALVFAAAAAIHAGIYWGFFYQPESINFTRTVLAH